IAIVFEYPIPNQSIVLNDVSSALSDYVDELASCQFVVFDGLPSATVPSDRTVYAVAEKETLDHLEEFDIPMLEKGILMGIPGALMNDALVRELCGITLLVSALRDIPDPEGALYLVEAANKAFEQLDVPLEPLREKSELLKEKLEEVAAHAKRELVQGPSKPHYGDFR
ncbi:MAG: PAC2 family protein, partial [Candidatus Heimdallarchaeota archaeon]|nr:PAC2 family protein [Candidatus Heimdallarchaeota archaeon]MCK5049316.1 PAC2 family protein [Candidatus Heimdallarchaeota archaeon]